MITERIKSLSSTRINRNKIYVLSVLFLSLLMIPILNNLMINRNFYQFGNINDDGKENFSNSLKTQDLSSDNAFSGVGSPWLVSHWANRTDYSLPVSFSNGTSQSKYMSLGSGWEGYQLNATIYDLYDKRNWVNGTFEAGDDDGSSSVYDDDSNELVNWTFHDRDIDPTYTNPMSGNYFDSASAPYGASANCIELRMNGESNGYDQGDKCWWESIFSIPRGDISEGEISLKIFPVTQYYPQGSGTGEFGTHWSFQAILNGVLIDDKNLIWLENAGDGDWASLTLQLTNWLDDPIVFPVGVKSMNLTLQLIRNGATASLGAYGSYQQLLIDDVSITVKAEAKPEQIGLRMNNQQVSDIDWGKGIVGQISTWTMTPVEVKFDSTEVRPFEMGGYDVEFKTNVNLFAKKINDKSDHTPNFDGTSFDVTNGSNVDWESYARVSVPTGYEETNMTIEFPEDIKITWISNAEYPNTNMLKYCDNSTLGILKVSNFSETPDGFWWLKAESPNYCTELNIYNAPTATGPWVLNSTFLSGRYINITGKIESSGVVDISSYIGNTMAQLYIRFPNGTIWTAQNQIKQVDNNGFVYFDPIMIPNDVPNYEIGEYEALITWNNSYSSFGLNETGIIYKKFNVIHDSILEPDQGIYFIENILDDRIVNIKVSYSDIIDGTAIENAIVYTTYSGPIQYFSEVSPGFYLFEFNASNANAGNNTLTIYANSTYYLNKVINITVDVVKQTLLTVESDFLTVPWNQNFTVRFNYTEKNDPEIGIDATGDISIGWLGEYHLNQPLQGQYELECNTSAYESLTLQSFIISLSPYKYESQSVLIRVQITELGSSLKLFVNNILTNQSDTIQVDLGEDINITVKYTDTITKQHLSGANVTLLGIGDINEIGNQYSRIITTDILDQGINLLTIIAQIENYDSQSINFLIEVKEKGTFLKLFVNNIPTNQSDTIQVNLGEDINITIQYKDNETKNHLPGANVNLLGIGSLSDIDNQYTRIINTDILDQGINVLTIFAQLENYTTQSINFFIEVSEKDSLLKLFVNNVPTNQSDTIQVELGEDVNITVKYTDTITKQHLSGANVTILGLGQISEIGNQYTRILTSGELDQGITILTIFAQQQNYKARTINFFIEVTEKESLLKLFVNNVLTNQSDTIQVELGEDINITVQYRDNETNNHLPGANVNLLGIGSLSDIDNQYTRVITTDILEQGITILTIFAQLDNYKPKTINFFIEVTEKDTLYQLFLNDHDSTTNPIYNLTIGEILNITVKYTDQTGSYIPNAVVQLVGEGILINLTRDDAMQLHYIELDTTDLKVGLNLFSILAQATNYKIQTVKPIITINRITTLINISSQINAEPGDDVKLRVILLDTYFGGTITDAIVTYRWGFGQGELFDTYNNGTYEIILENVPQGTYTITISAFAGDEYDFESKDITLIVTSPTMTPGPDLGWLIYILTGAILGLVLLFTLYQTHFKYPPLVRKIRKLKKKVKKGSKTKPILVESRENTVQNYLKEKQSILDMDSGQIEKTKTLNEN